MFSLNSINSTALTLNASARLEWVDIAKGVAIILMVIGHTGIPKPLSNWIYSFHMPLFFVLSGALTSWNRGISDFVTHKIKTLMFYFVVYSIINFILLQFCITEIREQSIVYLLTNGWGGFALWFIPVLFFSLILCRFISDKYVLIAIFTFLTIGWALATSSVSLPWSLCSIPYSSALILIGRYYSSFIKNEVTQLSPHLFIIILLSSLSGGAIISQFYKLDIIANIILPVIPITLAAILGVLFLILVSVWAKISPYSRQSCNPLVNTL